MNEQTILIVDDEPAIREVMRHYLEMEGFQVVEAETGDQALAMLAEQRPDLILLDVMLPGIDGFTLTRSLRRSRKPHSAPTEAAIEDDIPIIMLTSRGGEADRIVGFELGVDDYVVKPFSPGELVGRVRAVLRRSSPAPRIGEKPITFTDLQIDPLGRTVTSGGVAVTFTAKEFDLLWFFARHPQQVFTRAQLLGYVWGSDFHGDESTVTVHIRRLREKLERDPAEPLLIHTIWGVGYKFEPL